jgi:hypothetical protein
MLVALHGHHRFCDVEFVRQRPCAVRLRLVPVGIILRREVNVVCRRVTVLDRDRLLCYYTENVRLVVATVLIEHRRRRWRCPGKVANLLAVSERSVLDVNERIRELAVLDGPLFRHQIRRLGGALRISRRVDLLRFRRSAGKRHRPRDRAFIALRGVSGAGIATRLFSRFRLTA